MPSKEAKLGGREGSCTVSQKLNPSPELVLEWGPSTAPDTASEELSPRSIHARSKRRQGQRQGWSTGPKGPSSRWSTYSTGLRSNQQAEVETSTPMAQLRAEPIAPDWPEMGLWAEEDEGLRWGSSRTLRPRAPNDFVAFMSPCLIPCTPFDSWKSCPLLETRQMKSRYEELKAAVLFQVTHCSISISPQDTGVKDTSLSRVLRGRFIEKSESDPSHLYQVPKQKVWPKTLITFLKF